MHITVIGHICNDVIHNPDGEEVKGYGGIYYSLVSLANLLDENVIIYPVFGIGSKDYNNLIEDLSKYKNIDTSGIYKTEGQTNTVHLYYQNDSHRIECSLDIAKQIPFKKIKPYLDVNMLLINMISGFDITLETLDEIRIAVRDEGTPIYLDLHSLTLGISEDGKRFRRPVSDWRRWLFMLHAVQMNEEKAAGLSIESKDEEYLIKQITSLDTNNVIITRGANGCTLYKDVHKKIHKYEYKIENNIKTVDTTGCGDVFAAAYCAKYLYVKDVEQSVEYANRVASFKATLSSSGELKKLSEYRIKNNKKSEK
ncbi:MAG: hypothetical protein IGBAC_0280 [Ignavibacteriae bacterium]|nr:MAG: hypothetical protein IGBAC_0280 [Ignavibacteriota bacterium]